MRFLFFTRSTSSGLSTALFASNDEMLAARLALFPEEFVVFDRAKSRNLPPMTRDLRSPLGHALLRETYINDPRDRQRRGAAS